MQSLKRRFTDAPAILQSLCYRLNKSRYHSDPISGGVFIQLTKEAYRLAYSA